MSRRTSSPPGATEQAALWPDELMVAGFNLMNRRRSLIRRLDHLLEDAANEQFEEAAMVLRDALERLRMALVKDTLGLRDGGVER
jgi:recombinational DNA repair ATPase RecF